MNLNQKNIMLIKEEGFTLIEIMIAIALLAFGLLAMASMQVMAIQTTGKANRITEGTTMAMDKIEQFMASDYNAFTAGNDTTNNLYDIQWKPGGVHNTGIYKTKEVVITITPKHSLYKRDIVLNGVIVENL